MDILHDSSVCVKHILPQERLGSSRRGNASHAQGPASTPSTTKEKQRITSSKVYFIQRSLHRKAADLLCPVLFSVILFMIFLPCMFLPPSLMPSFPCDNYTFTTYLLYRCKENCFILFYFLPHYKFCLILCTYIINIKLSIYVFSVSVYLRVSVCVCCMCPFLCAHLGGKRPLGIFFHPSMPYCHQTKSPVGPGTQSIFLGASKLQGPSCHCLPWP